MKWLLAMVSKGRDVSEFFSDVVKNMAVRSVEVKKMVYIYLVHYADNDAQCRELALLSINSFQNDLRGSNQVCTCVCSRAWRDANHMASNTQSAREIADIDRKRKRHEMVECIVVENGMFAPGLWFRPHPPCAPCARRPRNVTLLLIDSSSKRSLFA